MTSVEFGGKRFSRRAALKYKVLFDGITGFAGFKKIKSILLSCQKQGCSILDELFEIAPILNRFGSNQFKDALDGGSFIRFQVPGDVFLPGFNHCGQC